MDLDYHVELAGHFYSVPHRHAHPTMEARLTARTVEVFLNRERIAAHMRGSGHGKHTTIAEHTPPSRRRYQDLTVDRIRREALALGPSTALPCKIILGYRPHPEQGFRSCLGIVRPAKAFCAARLEAACERALHVGARSYNSVKSIIDNRLDGQPVWPRLRNIRGSRYYN